MAYTIAAAFAVSAAVLVCAFVFADGRDAMRWHRAERACGLIMDYIGEKKVRGYGRRSTIKYHIYEVSCKAAGKDVLLKAALKREGLCRGNLAEARYVTGEDGEPEAVFPYARDRLARLAIGLAAGFLLAGAIIAMAPR